jgi:hypothetical protein
VCAACGAGIHYGPQISDVLFFGVLFAVITAVAETAFHERLRVTIVVGIAALAGAALAIAWYRGKVRFRRHVP